MKTSELNGPALDWAVAKCEALMQGRIAIDGVVHGFYRPSTDWAQGGPIIERERVDVMWCGDRWCAYAMTPDKDTQLVDEGPTPLIAAMRCYVASKMGDEIDVPEELL